MHTIILPVDFTPRSQHTVDYVASLYANVPVRIVLLHSYSTRRSSEILISIEDIIEKDIRLKLEQEGKRLENLLNSEKSEIIYFCERNEVIPAINAAISKYAVDLLVLGSDGEKSWTDVDAGVECRTLNMVKEISSPVLIVPANEDIHKPANILFATLLDGIRTGNEIEALVTLAKTSGAHLDVLNVGGDRASKKAIGEELKKAVNGYFNGVEFDVHAEANADTFQAIDHFSKEHENDLICIMYRKHNVLERLLKPSISSKVLHSGNRPILTLKHTA